MRREAAKQSAQYFVNSRWLGGTLTNWQTISQSIKRLRELEESSAGEGHSPRRSACCSTASARSSSALGGIKDMGDLPNLLFVIDTNKEDIAIKEARRLGIPVVAIIDTNSDPEGHQLPVPGNDDAGRALELYCDLVARAAIDGISRAQGDSGVDLGAAGAADAEELPAEPPTAAGFQGLPGRAASPTI